MQQVDTTIPAVWKCNVAFVLPRGHQWNLNGIPVTIASFRAVLAIPLPESVVQAAFPDTYAGLCFAASNGAYQPSGAVRDAFLSFAAAALSEGAQ
jgi:hypothetical protein